LNFKDYPRGKYSINQFTQPHAGELAGQKFHFFMDDGYDMCLNFTGKRSLEWNLDGASPLQAEYACLKGDDTTYLVDFHIPEFENTMRQENHLYVIDLEQRLVTRGIFKMGLNPKYPYIISSDFVFGAIDTEDAELPIKRHGFTTEMIGTRAEWHWSINTVTRHAYYMTSFYRFAYPGEELILDRDSGYSFPDLPNQDEKASYIKIKKNIYLFSLIEEMGERMYRDRNPPYRSDNLVFLQNYDRMYHVGRAFGNVRDHETNEIVPCHFSFGAFGNPVVIPEIVLNEENTYLP